MPWITDMNGEKKYKPSIYAKEELPTWDEVYNQFYKGDMNLYDPLFKDHQEPDPYWKLPRRKVLIAMVCNEFNKLLFEDGKLKDTLNYINENLMPGAIDVRFTCELFEPWDARRVMAGDKGSLLRLHQAYLEDWSERSNAVFVGTPDPHPIYTIPLPTGKENPFILKSTRIPRIDISKLDGEILCVHPIILFSNPPLKSTNSKIYTPRPFDPLQKDDCNRIIKFLMSDMINYFEGEGVGWKDEEGHLIEDKTVQKCASGYDPAL